MVTHKSSTHIHDGSPERSEYAGTGLMNNGDVVNYYRCRRCGKQYAQLQEDNAQ